MNQVAQRQSTQPQTLEGRKAEVMRLEREYNDRPSRDDLVTAAERMIAAYPNARPPDPQGYVDTMVAHLSKYPRVVLEKISDPRTGVVTKCVFPPVIAEVQEFAKPYLDHMGAALTRERRSVRQLESREPEISDEERNEMAGKLKGLANDMRASLDDEKETRKAKRPRAETCKPGDAIRKQMGIEKTEGR